LAQQPRQPLAKQHRVIGDHHAHQDAAAHPNSLATRIRRMLAHPVGAVDDAPSTALAPRCR
ncbi:MAG: hypothetical protein WKF96_25260, partial [Solirubrobacteraceae bacterium]